MNNKWNIIGLSIGLIGIGFSIYSYMSSLKSKEISYNLLTPSYLIYDKNSGIDPNRLKLYWGDSLRIQNNVYLTTISIWNSGDLPIEKSDIRKKIEFSFDGIDKVLNIKLIKEVEQGISNFQIIPISDNSYTLDWHFFDPHYGIKAQIIYTGNGAPKLKMEGKILNTKFKEHYFVNEDTSNIHHNYYKDIVFMICLFIVSILIVIPISYIPIIGNFFVKKTPEMSEIKFSSFLLSGFLFLLGIYLYLLLTRPTIPF